MRELSRLFIGISVVTLMASLIPAAPLPGDIQAKVDAKTPSSHYWPYPNTS